MDSSLTGSSVHGILQARILEWVVVPFSRDLPNLDWSWVSHIAGVFFTIWATREALKTRNIYGIIFSDLLHRECSKEKQLLCNIWHIYQVLWCSIHCWCSPVCLCWYFLCFNHILVSICFAGCTSGKEPACQCRRHKRVPGLGKSSGGGHGNPFQYYCLENSMDRGDWQATVHWVTKNQTQLKQLSTHACTQWTFVCTNQCVSCSV